jgi:hypothetical protein
VTAGVGQAVFGRPRRWSRGCFRSAARLAAPLVARVMTAAINEIAADDRELTARSGLYHTGVVCVASRLPPGRDSCRQVNYIFASVRLQH